MKYRITANFFRAQLEYNSGVVVIQAFSLLLRAGSVVKTHNLVELFLLTTTPLVNKTPDGHKNGALNRHRQQLLAAVFTIFFLCSHQKQSFPLVPQSSTLTPWIKLTIQNNSSYFRFLYQGFRCSSE